MRGLQISFQSVVPSRFSTSSPRLSATAEADHFSHFCHRLLQSRTLCLQSAKVGGFLMRPEWFLADAPEDARRPAWNLVSGREGEGRRRRAGLKRTFPPESPLHPLFHLSRHSPLHLSLSQIHQQAACHDPCRNEEIEQVSFVFERRATIIPTHIDTPPPPSPQTADTKAQSFSGYHSFNLTLYSIH